MRKHFYIQYKNIPMDQLLKWLDGNIGDLTDDQKEVMIKEHLEYTCRHIKDVIVNIHPRTTKFYYLTLEYVDKNNGDKIVEDAYIRGW